MSDIFAELANTVKKEVYTSTFDFASCEMKEEDIEFVKKGEQLLRFEFMNISSSLFEVCSTLNKISKKFKKNGDFMRWYENNGLTKDKVSELNKRFLLFQEFPDHKDFIANLSIQATKYLTHKDVTGDAREIIINEGVSKAETIKELLSPVKEQIAIEYKPKKLGVYKSFDKIKKKIKKINNPSELSNVKLTIRDLEKQLKEMKNDIAIKEKEFENKNNLKIAGLN